MILLLLVGFGVGMGLAYGYGWNIVGPASEPPLGYAVWAFEGIERLPLEFLRQLAVALLNLGVDPNAALSVMKHESNFRPDAKNVQKGKLIAAGLIQWIQSTAKSYGTSLDQLLAMDAMGQLPFVIAYWQSMAKTFPSRKGRWTPEQALRAVFFPSCVGKPDDYVIGDKDAAPKGDSDAQIKAAKFIRLIWDQNKGLDKNHDGKITAGEVDMSAKGIYAKAQTRPPILI